MVRIIRLQVGLSVALVACVLTSTNSISGAGAAESVRAKPNVILIMADDLGYKELGSYGQKLIKTPYLDQLAKDGMRFTRGYAGNAVCAPSRCVLLTGRHPGHAWVRNNGEVKPEGQRPIPASEVTIAEALKAHGYNTAHIGKWHLGYQKEFLPLNHGFDYYYGIPYSNDMDAINNFNYWDQYKGEELNSKNYNVPLIKNTSVIERPVDQTTITKRYTKEAIDFIKENKKESFFLYVAHNLPHIPLYASKKFLGKSKRGLYGDVIQEIDYGVGQIIKVLKKLKIDKNTIVVFTSDNGPWLPFKTHGGSAGLLKEGKGTTWEGGMRVPTIFWSPSNIKPAIISDTGSTMDLFSTFISIAGGQTPTDRIIDGFDITKTLFDLKRTDREVTYFYRGTQLYALRYKNYKAHFITQEAYTLNNKKMIHEIPLLYDLENDPSEKYNISSKNKDVIDKIRSIVLIHNSNMVKGKNQLINRKLIN